MSFKIFIALLFGFILAIGILLAIYRMYLIIQAHKKRGKYSIDDFFMAFIYGLFTLKYSVMKDHQVYQKTSAWMKIIYLLLVVSLVIGVFAYE